MTAQETECRDAFTKGWDALLAKSDRDCNTFEAFNAGWQAYHTIGKELAAALEYAIWQHEGGGSPEHGHWSVKARDALSKYRGTK